MAEYNFELSSNFTKLANSVVIITMYVVAGD